jgi:hypothetical protein
MEKNGDIAEYLITLDAARNFSDGFYKPSVESSESARRVGQRRWWQQVQGQVRVGQVEALFGPQRMDREHGHLIRS